MKKKITEEKTTEEKTMGIFFDKDPIIRKEETAYFKPLSTTPIELDELVFMFEKAQTAAEAIYRDYQNNPAIEKSFETIVKKKWAYMIMTEFYDWKME